MTPCYADDIMVDRLLDDKDGMAKDQRFGFAVCMTSVPLPAGSEAEWPRPAAIGSAACPVGADPRHAHRHPRWNSRPFGLKAMRVQVASCYY